MHRSHFVALILKMRGGANIERFSSKKKLEMIFTSAQTQKIEYFLVSRMIRTKLIAMKWAFQTFAEYGRDVWGRGRIGEWNKRDNR